MGVHESARFCGGGDGCEARRVIAWLQRAGSKRQVAARNLQSDAGADHEGPDGQASAAKVRVSVACVVPGGVRN